MASQGLLGGNWKAREVMAHPKPSEAEWLKNPPKGLTEGETPLNSRT